MYRNLLTLFAATLFAVGGGAQDSKRGYLGIYGEDSPNDKPGAVVQRLHKGGAGEKAGLKLGDRIVEVDGAAINDFADLAELVNNKEAGTKLKLKVERGEKSEEITVELQEAKPDKSLDLELPAQPLTPGTQPFDFGRQFRRQFNITVPSRPMIGVQLQEVDDALRERLKLGETVGVLIADVVSGSPAADAGLQSGDLIVEVDGQPYSAPDELSNYIGSKKASEKVTVKIVRDGKSIEKDVVLKAMRNIVPGMPQMPLNVPPEFVHPGAPFFDFGQMPGRYDEMQKRIDSLEKQVEELKRLVEELKARK